MSTRRVSCVIDIDEGPVYLVSKLKRGEKSPRAVLLTEQQLADVLRAQQLYESWLTFLQKLAADQYRTMNPPPLHVELSNLDTAAERLALLKRLRRSRKGRERIAKMKAKGVRRMGTRHAL